MLGEAVGLMNPAAMGMAAAALAGTVLSVALWMLAGRRGWLLFLPAFLVLGMGRAGLEQKICDREQALGLDGKQVCATGRLEAVWQREKGWTLELADCQGWLAEAPALAEPAENPARTEPAKAPARAEPSETWELRRLLVYTGAGEEETVNVLKTGNLLYIQGKARQMKTARNPGEFDYRQYYRGQGLVFSVMADSLEIRNTGCRPFREFLRRQASGAGQILEQITPAKKAGIFCAALLGDKRALDGDIRRLYQDQGIAHLLAVSGLHLSLLAGAVYGGFRLLGAGYGTGGVLGGLFLAGYSVMAGGSASVRRALVMTLCGFGAAYLGRTYDLLSALALAALLLLWESPCLIFQAGVQLSFGAILGIGVAAPCLERWLGEAEDTGLVRPAWLRRTLAAAIGIHLATVPVQLYHFYQIPLWGMALNLVLVPLMGLVLASGAAGVVLGSLSLRAGRFAVGGGVGILAFYEGMCRLCDRLPGSVLVAGRPEGRQILAYYLVLGAVLYRMYCRQVPGKRTRVGGLVLGAGILAAVLVPLPVKGLEVTVLDVGQGDGICLRTRQAAVLVDGGSSDEKELGRYRLEPYLKSRALTRIDCAVVSHPDQDHISGLVYLLEQVPRIRIASLVIPAAGEEDEAYGKLRMLVEESGGTVMTMKQGDFLTLGELTLTCLYPDQAPRQDRNEQSLVLRADYRGFHMLLTGDMSREGEQELLDSAWAAEYLEGIQVLKVAHHGSDSSTGQQWLDRVRPGFAVISYGEGNRYGHPDRQVTDALRETGTVIYETAKHGAVTIETDGKTARFSTFLPPGSRDFGDSG